MSTQTELTPAQEAQIPVYISNYTAMSFRTAAENSTDHVLACKAVERLFRASNDFPNIIDYHHLSYISNDTFADLKTGNPEAMKESFTAYKNSCSTIHIKKGYPPKPTEYFIICGAWPTLLQLARHWSGQANVTSNMCLAQNAVHAPAYACFVTKVLKLPATGDHAARLEEAEALHDFSAYVGCTLQYEGCTFAGDSPVAFKPLDEGERYCPIFTEAEALSLGLEIPSV